MHKPASLTAALTALLATVLATVLATLLSPLLSTLFTRPVTACRSAPLPRPRAPRPGRRLPPLGRGVRHGWRRARAALSLPGLLTALALLCTALALLAPRIAQAAEPGAVVVIGHAALPRLDGATVARLYTGRAVELAGMPVTVVNAPAGSALRQRFLAHYLQQDDDQYRAYWTVRRHVGKGLPPRELSPSAEVIQFVQATPGAVGYIDAAELRPGLNVLARP